MFGFSLQTEIFFDENIQILFLSIVSFQSWKKNSSYLKWHLINRYISDQHGMGHY